MALVYRRPPAQYREAINTDPCGGPQNANNGCQVVFPRMEPGGRLCFLCVKLQDPEISCPDRNEIRVSLPPSTLVFITTSCFSGPLSNVASAAYAAQW